MLAKSFPHDCTLAESHLQREEMFLSLSLFLRKHVPSLAKSSRLKKSPPGCDNTQILPRLLIMLSLPPFKPFTFAMSPPLSNWLFLEQTHIVCATKAKSGKLQTKKKKRKKKRGAALCSIIYNMKAFITSYFVYLLFDSLSEVMWCSSYNLILNPGSSVHQLCNLGQIT